MQPEDRISGTRKDIAARIPAGGEVPRGMHAKEADGEVALHARLEASDVRVVGDEVGGLGVGGPALRHPRRDVAFEAARVVG